MRHHSTLVLRGLKHWPIGLVLVVVFLLGQSAHGEIIQNESVVKPSVSLEQLGKQLREAIEQEYQRLDDAKALTPRSGGNIGELVRKYIPIGTSFDDAEQILRGAGFKVGPREGPNTPAKGPVHVPNPKYFLAAEIIALHGSLLTFRTVSVVVYLTPKDPDNYDKVNEVGGSIYTSYP
jgi:hypothetical protein